MDRDRACRLFAKLPSEDQMSLLETIERIRSAPVPTNEEAAKIQILLPLLRDLDWDPFGPEVLYEHRVPGKGGGRVDIALQGLQHVVGLVEAKSPGQNLSKHVAQLIGYAFHQGVDICVLTTGLEWWLYLPMEMGPPEKRLFTRLHVQHDRPEQVADDLNTFLGRSNLRSGQARRKAKQVLKARHLASKLNAELPKVWQSMLSGPDDDLVELVRQRAYETLDLRPEREQVAAVLKRSPIPTVTKPPEGEPPKRPEQPKTPERLTLLERREDAVGKRIRAFDLWGNRYDVDSWSDFLARLAELLYERHPDQFDRILKVTSGPNRAPIATRDPGQLTRSRKIGDSGIYLNSIFKATSGVWRAHRFLEILGYRETDIRLWCEEAGTKRPLTRGAKPRAFILWGSRHEVNTWKDFLVGVTFSLYQRHARDFDRILELRGRIRPYATLDPEELLRSSQVGESEYHIDVNLSAKDCVLRARRFLEHFGHPASDLTILDSDQER